MKFGFEKRVLREDGFYNIMLNGKQVGFNLDLRINYYRYLPLSSVHKIEVTVDGENELHIPRFIGLGAKRENLQFIIEWVYRRGNVKEDGRNGQWSS